MTGTPVVIRGRQSDDQLKLSYDRKVTPTAIPQQSRNRWVPTFPNSFGLPAGTSCPGKTEFCVSCYASSSEQSKGVGELVNHNLRLLLAASYVEKVALLDEMMSRCLQEARYKKIRQIDMIFRIHWDGDFFSVDYARAWAEVARHYPEFQFWTYTRSFTNEVNVLPYLVGIENLTVYLSIDKGNHLLGLKRLGQYRGMVRAAWCGGTQHEAEQLAGNRPAVACPENTGELPLIERGRGACVRCKLCPDNKADIIFMAKKPRRARKGQQELPLIHPGSSTRNCAYCKQPFTVVRKRGRPAKYCCTQCRWSASRER